MCIRDRTKKDAATALVLASKNGHGRILKILLTKGAKIDHQTKEGYTALMRASQYGHTEIVLTLMDTGANLKLRNNRGLTAENLSSEPHIEIMLNAAAAMK